MEVWIADAPANVTEGIGEVVVTIQRAGYISSDMEVYCYVDAAGKTTVLLEGIPGLLKSLLLPRDVELL